MSAGYSGTPLSKKLGIKSGFKLYVCNAPPEYATWLEPLPADVEWSKRLSKTTDLVHLFTTRQVELKKKLSTYRQLIQPAAMIWVSWPKKAAKVATDITEDSIRDIALPLGLVDIKVCAVDSIWSGLKLVIRKELRG
jgi:hypothetical protein